MSAIRNEKGQFVPGHSGTKPKGSIHKVTIELQQTIGEFLRSKSNELPKLWNKLSDRDKIKAYIDLMRYVVPQMRDVSITATNQPTKEAIADLFDFNDPDDTKLWIERKKAEVFPANDQKALQSNPREKE